MSWKSQDPNLQVPEVEAQIADHTVCQAEGRVSSLKQKEWSLEFNEHLPSSLLCARHHAGRAPLLGHVALTFTLGSRYHLLCFAAGEVEAQKGDVTHPRSHGQ